MKAVTVLLRVVGYIWVAAAIFVILFGIFGIWMSEGFSGIQRVLSPFNIMGWLVTVATLAPGFVLLILADKIGKKQTNPEDEVRQAIQDK